jgi:hypothetical protein
MTTAEKRPPVEGGDVAATKHETKLAETAIVPLSVDAVRERMAIIRGESYSFVAALDTAAANFETPQGYDTNRAGLSLIELAELKVDNSAILLGSDRYLCRGGSMLLVGPSGIGKSSAGVQMDAGWAAGLPVFGIAPAGPLRILTIQAENDDDDLGEMSRGVIEGLSLNPDQVELVQQNTLYLTRFETGNAFLSMLNCELQNHKPDLLRIDPLNSFIGGDAKDPALIAEFCRSGLNPLLYRYKCGAIVAHHTPKTNFRDTSGWSALDWAYAGSGGADLTNWARSVLVIDVVNIEEGLFRFIAAKRGGRIGWRDDEGYKEFIRFFCHSKREGVIHWAQATPEIVKGLHKTNQRTNTKPEDALEFLDDNPMGKADFIDQVRQGLGIGEKKAQFHVKVLLERGTIHEHKIKRSQKRDRIVISRKAFLEPQS